MKTDRIEIMDTQNLQSNTLKAILISGTSLILGFLFDYFFVEKIPGISFPLYVVLIIAGLFSLAIFFKKRINKEVFWLLIPLIFFSTMVFVRSSEMLTVFNILASLLLLLIIAKISFGEKVKSFLIENYIKILFLPIEFIHPLFQTLSDLFLSFRLKNDQKRLSQIIKGVLMTIPVLFVFLLLFSSADLIFQKYVSDLINIDINPEIISRFILVLMATLAYIGTYSYLFKKRENQEVVWQDKKNYSIGNVESSILFGSVNILFFIFILIQLTYLFGGESNISVQGFTYAEYVRRGFFELIAVAVVSLLLLLFVEKYIAKKEKNHLIGFKILSAVLILQVILIMVSAFIRLSLYEEAYGFTDQRLFSHAFIILLAVIFFLLFYKIHKDREENAFAFHVFISIILFLAVMNFLNPDAFIARRNIERFVATGKLDAYYLGSLSSDAIPETIKILDISDENIRNIFARGLYWRAQDINSSYSSKWQSLNISRIKAKKILNSRMNEIEPYKDYQLENPNLAECCE